ncbi:MAG: TetR/AcrR family transcriptional regulator [Roseburia sp.]
MSDQNSKTERNQFTRMCIGDAIISLMQTEDFDSLKISDICKKAGLSRMTFYHYYDSKTAVLMDYMNTMIEAYQKENEAGKFGSFHEYHHILHALTFFDQYADFFLTLERAGLHSLILEAVNHFMEEQVQPSYSGSVYKLYYYAGALTNLFLKWEEKGKVDSAEEIALIISQIPLS